MDISNINPISTAGFEAQLSAAPQLPGQLSMPAISTHTQQMAQLQNNLLKYDMETTQSALNQSNAMEMENIELSFARAFANNATNEAVASLSSRFQLLSKITQALAS